MTLPIGSRLGPYEILSPLGAGGMGEVYRARDERLRRDVAIKVLPSSVAADGDRLRRFEQEAQAAGALNHPNITAVYDFGSHEGSPYIVTELLEGETLRAALAGGPLPLRKALDYALQIARALAVAHEKGIVHRDLKPENLFVTSDGRIKILDFGLARVARPEASEGSQTSSPTASPATEPGVVLGTLGYMSPEQVRGRPLDARTDIFSFGAILYEMLSGNRAFAGDSAADTMSAILREDAPELSTANRSIPPGVEKIVRHCLEKNPADRFRSAHDLAFGLDALTASSVASASVALSEPPRPRARLAAAAAVLVAIAAAAFLAGRLWRGRAASSAQPSRPASFQQLTDTRGVESQPTLSPDGKSVVYVSDAAGNLGLYLLRVGGRNPVSLTADSTADNWQPAFSPDGEKIAFRSERDGGGIFLMGSTGESVRRLTDFGFNPTWSPDGREIAVAAGAFVFASDRAGTQRGLWAVNVATGGKRILSKAGDTMQPSWSPHGRRIAYWGLRGNSGQRDIWTVAADGSEAEKEGVPVTNDAPLDWSPAWSPDGKFLYFSSNRGGTMNLWRVAIDESSGRVLGEPEPVTSPSLWSGEVSFSRDGKRFAFSSLDWRSSLFKLEFDPLQQRTVGLPVPILRGTLPIRDHQLSPDGKWVAFMQTSNQEDLFVAQVNGGEYRRLTDDAFRDRGPTWSPDGQRIVFYSDRSGSYQLWMIRPDGSGLEQLTSGQHTRNFPVWSPDGAEIAVSAIEAGWQIVDLRSKESPRPARPMPEIDDSSRFWPLSWSPDGKRLAGPRVRLDGTAGEIMTFTLATQRYEKVMDAEDGFFKTPVWLSDSRRLLVRGRKGIALLDTETRQSRKLLDVRGYWIGLSLGVSRDDRWITYTETGTEGDIWLAELK
ncbi:MAG TPA: protein kinase [Thermoanaerobaculia bacterium]|nr:protein kinase [Thermoanaerobaculia bacterium]